MKKAVKGAVALALGVAMMGSLAGCGGGSPNNYSKYDEDGRLILTIWATDQYADAEIKARFQGYLDKFNATDEMKELGVTLQFSAMSLLPSTLNTACLTGPQKMPDIVIWDRFSTPSYTNILLPLDDLIAQDSIDKTEFLAEAYNELTVGGVQYGLPLDADPWGIYVNMDAVNSYNEGKEGEALIDVDNLNTWSALLDAGEKLTMRNEKNIITRSGLNTTSADGQFFSFVYTGTGELIDTREGATYGDTVMKEGTALFGDAQSLRVYDTLAYFKELYKKDLCDTGHGGTEAFGNGLCAMTYGSIYFPQELSKYALKNYKMLPYPARDRTYVNDEDAGEKIDPNATDSLGMKNGQVGGMLGGFGLTIPQPVNKGMHTDDWKLHVEKSWEVIKLWLMNDKINELYFTENQSITCRTDFWTTNTFYTENTGVIGDILPYLENYKMRPSVAGYELFESSVVRSQIQAMKEGNTVYNTYGDILTSGNRVLRQAQGRG